MRLLLVNRDGRLEVQLYFPMGGASPTGIYVDPGEVVLVDVKPGEIEELQRERVRLASDLASEVKRLREALEHARTIDSAQERSDYIDRMLRGDVQ